MNNQPLKKILFVDDDKDILTIVKFCVEERKDLEAFFVYSGEEAVRQALILKPDLIVLDVMMPRMDGVATLKALRMLPGLNETPVIFLTAKAQKSEIEEYKKLGIIDVITKPFDPLTVIDQVETIWKNHKLTL